jgi:HSP20 family molecular chaperone IbpA
MVRRFHRSVYDELDELKASMDYLFQLAFEPMDNPMLPQEEDYGREFLFPHNLEVEVVEGPDEVIVTVDILPGIEPSKLSVQLRDPVTLVITCDREEGPADDRPSVQDLRSVSLHQEVLLPAPVRKAGARATLNHGVLDLCFVKARRSGT